MSEYLGEAVVNLDIRPLKGAYLVRQGSISQFKRALTHACGRWGGMQEPIVPVSARGRVSGRWTLLLDGPAPPDQVFNVSGLTLDSIGIKTRAGAQIAPVAMLDRNYWSVFHPLGAHSPDEIVGMQVLIPSRPQLVDWVGAGTNADPNELAQWAQLGARVIRTDDRLALALAQLSGQTVLAKTVHQCEEVLVENPWSASIVWLTERNSYRDCLEFWNRRALMTLGYDRDLAILTTPDVFTRQEFLRSLGAWLDNRRHTSKPTFVLASRSIPKQTLRDLALSVGFEIDDRKQMTISYRMGGTRTDEPSAGISVAITKFFPFSTKILSGIRTSTNVQMFRDHTTIRASSPLRSHPMYGSGPCRLRLSGPAQLKAPKSPSVATLFHKAAEWVQGELEIPFTQSPTLNLEIAVPQQKAILDAALSDRGLKVELSSPGRYAQAVLGRFESAQLFSGVGVARVISALTGPSSKRLVQELKSQTKLTGEQAEVVAARLGPRLNPVAMTAKQIRKVAGTDSGPLALPEVVDILDRLSVAGLIHRGLVTECPSCGIDSFAPLPNVDSMATCPACGSRGRFGGDTTGPQLHYRLNALLDQASANGVLGHLYAAAALEREDENTFLMAGANIKRLDGTHSETDVLALNGDRITSGEVKQSAKWFTPTQIQDDIALSAEIGAARHLMACLEALPLAMIARASKLSANAGLQLVVLDGTSAELRSIDKAAQTGSNARA